MLCVEIDIVKCGNKIKYLEFVEKITEFFKLQQFKPQFKPGSILSNLNLNQVQFLQTSI